MRRAAVIAAAAALAGCDQAPPPSPAPAEAIAATPIATGPSAPVGQPISGTVSSLTGKISGFTRRETATQVIVELSADTLFAFDRAELTPAAEGNLAKVADVIRAGAPGPIEIVGFTDAKGAPPYNQTLSEQRARAVADWMGRQVGVRLRQFTVAGKGEADPVAPNTRSDGGDDPDGRARNRRVEVRIPK